MATKDHSTLFKDKQHFVVVGDNNLNGQFNNFNLNQNHHCLLSVQAIHSENAKNNNKEVSDYVLGVSHKNDTTQTQQYSTLKSKLCFSSANLNAQNGDDYGKQKETKERKILNTNNSTLSLHITTYENSIDANSDVPINGEKNDTNKKKEKVSIKSWKAVKERLNSSSQTVNYAFELPRQQQDQPSDPAVMQFKASQRLLNINQAASSGNAELIKDKNRSRMEVDIPMLDLSDTDEEEIHSFIQHDDEPMDADEQVGNGEELEPAIKAQMLESEYKIQHSRYIAQKSFYGDDDEVTDEQKVEYQLIDGHGDDDKDYFDDNWDKIRANTISILQNGTLVDPNVGQEEIRFLTFAVADIVNHGQSDSLTSRLRGVMEEYAPKIFDQTVEGVDAEDLIDRVYSNWTDFKRKLDILSYLYMFLNGRVGQRGSRPIWPMGISCLIKLFDNKFELLDKIADKLIALIDHERRTTEIDFPKVKSLVVMFSSLRQYDSIFEPKFILATAKFYAAEALLKFEAVDLPGYIEYANQRISEEAHRVERYLNSSSKQKLYRTVHSKIVEDLCDQMIIKGADELFDGNHIDNLRSFYDLLRDCKDGHNHLKGAFANYIKKVGKARVLDEQKDKALVEDLLQLKEKLDNLIAQCFDHNDKFIQAEKDAFSYFVNTRPNKPAELIAKYMDTKMRAANKSYNDADFDKLMDRVILLFRFIQGKDVFEAFYKRDLAKRLLCGKSASVDAEKAMLSKLRSECGPGFTSKLEGMFRDMDVSKDTLQAFRTHIEKTNPVNSSTTEFNVNVLTMGSWPTYDAMDVIIPLQLNELQEAFKEFYLSKNKGRQLTWQYNLASASMNSRFKNGTKELEVSMFQAFVLLLYNDRDQYTFKEIQDATKIENNELIRTMISLSASKTPILKRTKAEKQKIMPDEIFTFNDEFTDKMHKIKISQVQMKETEREQQQTEEEVEQDRLYVIDANIVRIMKQHKNLNHTALINELFTVLRFPARNQDVKKRIESLIEREYVARDDHDQQVYRYVA